MSEMGMVMVSILAQAAGGAAPAVADSVKIESIWDFVVKGGPVMIPIGLCSLIALSVIIERLFSLKRSSVIPPGFLTGLRSVTDRRNGDRASALAYCQSNGSPLAIIVAAGLKKLHAPRDQFERAVADAGGREVAKLRKYLRVLSFVIAVSPLLGLLGTILGMISAFQTVAASGENLGRTELLAKGIYEAMITTAAGLIVTIPALACYHWLSAKIDRLVSDMDALTIEFFEGLADEPAGVAAAAAGVSSSIGSPRADEKSAVPIMLAPAAA